MRLSTLLVLLQPYLTTVVGALAFGKVKRAIKHQSDAELVAAWSYMFAVINPPKE